MSKHTTSTSAGQPQASTPPIRGRVVGSKDLWMQVHWGHFSADFQLLSTEEVGAYILLVSAYWLRGSPLPNDPDYLSNIAKVSRKRWKILSQKVRVFFEISEGEWRHPYVENQILKANLRSAKAQLAGSVRKGSRSASAYKRRREEDYLERDKSLSRAEPAVATAPAGPPRREVLSAEDEFWELKPDCQAAKVPWSMVMALAKLRAGEFEYLNQTVRTALSKAKPASYLAAVLKNARAEAAGPVAPPPDPTIPEFVQAFQRDGVPVERRANGNWRCGGVTYDPAGREVGW